MNMKKEALSSSLFVLETKENTTGKVSPNRFSGPGGFPYNPKQKVIVKSRLPNKLKRKTRDKLTHLSLDKVDKIFAEDSKFISSKPLPKNVIENNPNELTTSIDSKFSSKIDAIRESDIDKDDQELDNFSDHKIVSDQDLIKEWLAEGGSEICYSRAGRIYKNAFISAAEKSKANKSYPAKAKRSVLDEEKLSCSTEFLSLSRWKAASINPSLQLYFLKAIKFVLLRENAINDLTDTLRELDTHYWKYCCVRIYAITNKLPTLQNQLLQRLQYLTFLHDKVSVAIAHYRSLTIKSIESILSWREKCHLLIDTNEEVTLLWKGESYLSKIYNDSQSFSKYYSIKTWLGFTPNIFFIPPSIGTISTENCEGYSPKHIWETTRHDLYRDWIRRSKAHLKHKAKAKQILSYSLNSNRTVTQTIGGIGTTIISENYPQVELSQLGSNSSNPTRQPSIVFQETQFRRQSKFHMSEEEEAEQSEEVLPSRSRRTSMVGSSSYTNGSKPLPIESNASIFANAVGVDTFFTPYAVDLMGVKASVIRSQISMDSTSVRPRGSWDLSSTTSACQTVSDIQSLPSLPIEIMFKEIENGWKELQDISGGSWDTGEQGTFWKDLLLKPQVVEAAVGYRECFPVRDFVPQIPESLFLRCKRLESEVMRELELIADFQAKVQESEELKAEVSNTVSVENLHQISQDLQNEKFHGSSVLLKNRQCHSLPSLPPANSSLLSVSQSQSQSQSQQSLAPMDHRSTLFLTATSLPETAPESRLLSPLRIKSDRLESLVKRVQKRRELTTRTELGLKVKADAPVRQRASSQGMLADQAAMRKMQRITRAFIERRRSCKMAEVIKTVKAVVTMQRVYRGWKGRTLARMRRKIFRRDIFVLRKYVLRVQRASLVIQRFMRWAYYVYQYANANRPLQHASSMIRRAIVKAARNKLNQAAATIQVAWRYQVGLVARRERLAKQSANATLIQMAFRRFATSQRISRRRVKIRREKSSFSVSRKFGHRFSVEDEVNVISIAVRLGRSRNATPRNSVHNISPSSLPPVLPSMSANASTFPTVLSPLTTTVMASTSLPSQAQSQAQSKLPLTPTSNTGMVSSVSAWSSSTRNRIDAVIREKGGKRRPVSKQKKSDSTSITSSNVPESSGDAGDGDGDKVMHYPLRRSNDAYISPAIKCRKKKEDEASRELDDMSILTLRVEKSKKDVLKSVLKAAITGSI